MARKTRKVPDFEFGGIGGRLYKRESGWWGDVRFEGKRHRIPLKTHLKTEAIIAGAALLEAMLARQKALAEANAAQAAHSATTLGGVFDWYREVIASKLNKKGTVVSKAWRTAAETRMRLFEAAWTRKLIVADVSQSHIEKFISARRAGTLSSLKPADAESGRKAVTVRLGTTDSDLRFLKACFAYASRHTVGGVPFLAQNPLLRLTWPKELERNKLRPRASADRYEKTQAHTDTVDTSGALRCALALARHTGHREGAIIKLRVSDLLLTTQAIQAALRMVGRDEADAKHMPHGAVVWRAENDKMGAVHLSALNAPARKEVDRYLQKSGRIGEAWLFPSPKIPEQHINRRLASRQLLKAEAAGGLEKLKGGIWHPYRRAWATERKGFNDVDVAAAGGWGDTRALKLSYQQSDVATMLDVVNFGT